MSRLPRVLSSCGVYHVMLRSVNRQQIFFDEEDYQYFTYLLLKYKMICGYKLYAYCLMGNHIHILIYISNDSIETVFKRIGSSFVHWYNIKYDRTGHLFQDRFKSEPVNDSTYFLTVLRYILQNPVAAGFCKSPADYKYGSGPEYFRISNGITDTLAVRKLFDENSLKDFLTQRNDSHCMDLEVDRKKHCSDAVAKKMILDEFRTYHPVIGKSGERRSLYLSVKKLIKMGISIRQLSRLTGISKKIIETGIKEKE